MVKLTAKLENSYLARKLKKLLASKISLHRQLSIRYIEENKNEKVKPEEIYDFSHSTKNISNCSEVDNYPDDFTSDKGFSSAESNLSPSPSIDSCFSEKYTFSFTDEDISKYQSDSLKGNIYDDVPQPVPVNLKKLITMGNIYDDVPPPRSVNLKKLTTMNGKTSPDNGYESDIEIQSATQSLKLKKEEHLYKRYLSKSAVDISTHSEILSDYDIAHRLYQWDYLLYLGEINIQEYRKKRKTY